MDRTAKVEKLSGRSFVDSEHGSHEFLSPKPRTLKPKLQNPEVSWSPPGSSECCMFSPLLPSVAANLAARCLKPLEEPTKVP